MDLTRINYGFKNISTFATFKTIHKKRESILPKCPWCIANLFMEKRFFLFTTPVLNFVQLIMGANGHNFCHVNSEHILNTFGIEWLAFSVEIITNPSMKVEWVRILILLFFIFHFFMFYQFQTRDIVWVRCDVGIN